MAATDLSDAVAQVRIALPISIPVVLSLWCAFLEPMWSAGQQCGPANPRAFGEWEKEMATAVGSRFGFLSGGCAGQQFVGLPSAKENDKKIRTLVPVT